MKYTDGDNIYAGSNLVDRIYLGSVFAYQSEPVAYTVVPNVYGYGTDTRAAYGGTVDPLILHVDTLVAGISNTDATHGSFEWAVSQSVPRVVVFDVSGAIQMTGTRIDIANPYMSIYGQTAPDKVCIEGCLTTYTSDILYQHIAVRNTDATTDLKVMSFTSYLGPNANIVVDHCSLSWGTGETFNVWDSQTSNTGITDITFSNCIGAEGIYNHATSLINGGRRISSLGNLFAHNNNRHPFVKEGSHTACFNNLVYNYGYKIAQISGDYTYNSPCLLDFRGNYVKFGPDTDASAQGYELVSISADYFDPQELQLYMSDNVKGSTTYPTFDVLNLSGLTGYEETSTPLTLPVGCSPYSSASTYNTVLAKAGARPADRDTTDARIIGEVQAGTGAGISVVPTLPAYTATTTVFVPVANPHVMYDTNYTNLEHQMHLLAIAVE